MRFQLPITKLNKFILVLFFTISGIHPLSVVSAQDTEKFKLSQFDLLNASSGWILLDGHLFWTSDEARSWEDISPTIPPEGLIQDIEFLDSNKGWVLWTVPDSNGSIDFQLAQTSDNGQTWTVRALPLFEPGETASHLEKAQMGWFDIQRGWLSVKQNTGSNFSIGTLFTTVDGGNSWMRSILPVADRIYFSDPKTGWAVGGPANDRIYETQDAGVTWIDVQPTAAMNGAQTILYPPFISGNRGLLLMTSQGIENVLVAYAIEPPTNEWSLIGQVKLGHDLGRIGVSILDSHNFVAALPGTNSILRMVDGELGAIENTDGYSASIVELDMITLENGWAKSIDSNCVTGPLPDPGSASVSCSHNTQLLQTTDGGRTWQPINLPVAFPGLAPSIVQNISNTVTTSAISGPGSTEMFAGQGFDKCEIPTLSQMQRWWNSSPYKVVNLYIGGSSRACNNTALTSYYLFQLSQVGWKFIPTWVGPQAPCTGYLSRMSGDVNTAYQQGITQANLAVEQLSVLGLTDPAKTGSVIYYDMESYGTDTVCRNAVNAFMNGWVSQLHARGSLAGVYGSTLCNTGLSDFRNITNTPDVIWAARWYHSLGAGYYDPTASVWNLGSCIPNTAWPSHQRIRQYEGDHNETWGDLTLGIDSNVLDGVVAVPFDYPFVTGIVRSEASPTNATIVSFTVIFSKPVTGVDKSDFTLSTSGLTGSSIGTVVGSGSTYTVTVSTGIGNGTIRLNAADNGTIVDTASNPLGGVGTGNGSFSNGETYTITKSANVNVLIGNKLMGSYDIPSGGKVTPQFSVMNGPVNVISLDSTSKFASERVHNGTGFINELMGLPNNQMTKEYWFPWYDNVSMKSWILVGNPSTSNDAHVHIYIAGVEQTGSPYTIPPGDRITPRYSGIQNGPVHVVSDISVFASERVHTNQGFVDELPGMPDNQLTTWYWFPWYDNLSMRSWILVGNPNTSQIAHVDIYIAGVRQNDVPYEIPPGEIINPQYHLQNGPVKVVSDINVFASERVHNASGFINELMGMPDNQLTTQYWFPWYDNKSMKSWVVVGNPSTAQTANVDIYIAGVKQNATPYQIGPGGRITPRFDIQNGPVKVVSNINVFASERVHTTQGFVNELMGMPNNQLATQYWFPWYDNLSMQSWILVGKP